MAGMDGPVDRAYLVSVEDLRDICVGLTDGEREYQLTRDDGRTVAISYNDGPDDLNSLCFTFPIVVDIWTLGILARNEEAGLMVCLKMSISSRCAAQYCESSLTGATQTRSLFSSRDGRKTHSHLRSLMRVFYSAAYFAATIWSAELSTPISLRIAAMMVSRQATNCFADSVNASGRPSVISSAIWPQR